MSEAASSEEPRGEFVTNVKDLKVGDEVWYRPTHDKRWMRLTIHFVDSADDSATSYTSHYRTRIGADTCNEGRVASVILPAKAEAAPSDEPRGERVEYFGDLKVGDEVWYSPIKSTQWHRLTVNAIAGTYARTEAIWVIDDQACIAGRVARVIKHDKKIDLRRDLDAATAYVARVAEAFKAYEAHESLKSQLTNAQSDISRISAEKAALEKELTALRNGTELVKAQARANTAEAEVKRLTAAYDKLASSERERDYQKLRSEHGHCEGQLRLHVQTIVELRNKIERIKAVAS